MKGKKVVWINSEIQFFKPRVRVKSLKGLDVSRETAHMKHRILATEVLNLRT